MCGILYTNIKNIFPRFPILLDRLMHRGPDAQKIISLDDGIHGHTRLSFQDLTSNGTQPLVSICKNYYLIFNGEIYNFHSLKKDLTNKGAVFKTKTDTEVLLFGLVYYGIDFISELDGMFSFIFEDRIKNEIFMARDQHGMKPLFYSLQKDGIIAGSELKVFENYSKNHKSFIDYLIFGYIPEPNTIYKNVYCVPTDHLIKYNKFSNKIQKIAWKSSVNYKYSLQHSVNLSLISDVPVATFFSGGIDSTLISYYSALSNEKNYSFGLGFSNFALDESAKQSKISKNLNFSSETFIFQEKELENNINEFLNNLDYPSTDGFNSYLLCKKAKELGYKACLSGLGADELFGGYPTFSDHNNHMLWNITKHIPEKYLALHPKLKKLTWLKYSKILGKYLSRRAIFTPREIVDLLGVGIDLLKSRLREHENYVSSLGTEQIPTLLEQKYYMRGQLLRDTDYFSMMNSVEVRMPYLNGGITNWSKESQDYIYKQNYPKKILLENQPNHCIKVLRSVKKQGFILPFDNIIKKISNENNYHRKSSYTAIQKWALIVLDKI